MGSEAKCVAQWKGQQSEGRALLETDFLIFRGEFRTRIPFKEIQTIKAAGGTLTIACADGVLRLELGAAAEKWLKKIRNPPALLDKLGIRKGCRIALHRMEDAAFLDQLKSVAEPVPYRSGAKCDCMMLGVESKDQLVDLPKTESAILEDGFVWVVYPKGQKHITEGDVLAAGKAAGFVDVKVASFSSTHTALKMMIPVARRSGKPTK
jgi:hypothetical protein